VANADLSMNVALLGLHVLNFLLIIVTPRFFFRRDGAFNLKWWLTALPFGLCPAALLLARVTGLAPYRPASWTIPSELVAVIFAVGSVSLLFYTLGTHRVPISLWHQVNDAPPHIVTEGAYRRIRHPFYTSYLLAFGGAVVFFPHWTTLTLAICVVGVLNATAAKEERRLTGSEYGAEYARYAARTGRFIPWRRPPGPREADATTTELQHVDVP
jgi:protein-S-isoprenylcysteine O-methyltransferase Ste14